MEDIPQSGGEGVGIFPDILVGTWYYTQYTPPPLQLEETMYKLAAFQEAVPSR